MSSDVYSVLVISPALGHDEPVSVGCSLYNEASVVKGCLVISSNVIVQRLDKPIDFFLIELSIIDYKDKESYSDERRNCWKSLLLVAHFCDFSCFLFPKWPHSK